jgi:hypothetical protein
MLAHKAEEEAVAVVEYIKKGYGHVNYGASESSSIVFMLIEEEINFFQFLRSCTHIQKSLGWARTSKRSKPQA